MLEETDETVDQDDYKVSPGDVVADREVESTEVDFWTCPGDVLMVQHIVPRSTLFIPTDENCPFPMKYFDVTRRTYTDLENKQRQRWKTFGQTMDQGNLVTLGGGKLFSQFFAPLLHLDTSG